MKLQGQALADCWQGNYPTYSISLARNVVDVANTGSNRKRLTFKLCGYKIDYHYTCDTCMTICGTRKRPECLTSHASGIKPKTVLQKERHKRKRVEFAAVTRSRRTTSVNPRHPPLSLQKQETVVMNTIVYYKNDFIILFM